MVDHAIVRKRRLGARQWEAAAGLVARAVVGEMYECAKCSYSVISGNCCTGCGDSKPYEPNPKKKRNA